MGAMKIVRKTLVGFHKWQLCGGAHSCSHMAGSVSLLLPSHLLFHFFALVELVVLYL